MAFGFSSSFGRSFRAGERPVSITAASQLPNLEVWYYADTNTQVGVTTGQEVSAWANAGGLSSHDWNSTGGARPEWFSNIQNGKGVVRFNNTGTTPAGEDADNNERLTINPVPWSSFVNGTGALPGATLVILFRSLSTAAGIRYMTSSNDSDLQWGQNGTTWIGATAGATFTVSGVTADTNWHHIVLTFDGTQTGNANRLKARLDGTDVTLSFTGTVGTALATNSGYFYGGCTGTNTSNTNSFYIGDLGEVLIWTRALTTSETLSVEQYLTTKWAV